VGVAKTAGVPNTCLWPWLVLFAVNLLLDRWVPAFGGNEKSLRALTKAECYWTASKQVA